MKVAIIARLHAKGNVEIKPGHRRASYLCFMAEFLDPQGNTVKASEAATLHCDAQGVWWVRIGAKNYRIEVHQESSGRFDLRVNGRSGELKKYGLREQLMERMGIADAANEAEKNLCAPMPGRVLEIRVKAGDELVSGEALIVLEAMKMENVLAAQGDVKVSVVHVATGESVEKGAVLIEFT